MTSSHHSSESWIKPKVGFPAGRQESWGEGAVQESSFGPRAVEGLQLWGNLAGRAGVGSRASSYPRPPADPPIHPRARHLRGAGRIDPPPRMKAGEDPPSVDGFSATTGRPWRGRKEPERSTPCVFRRAIWRRVFPNLWQWRSASPCPPKRCEFSGNP